MPPSPPLSARTCSNKSKSTAPACVNSSGNPWPGTCPNFENGGCNGAVTQCDQIVTCVSCIDEAAVDQAIDLYYDAFTANPSTAVRKCQPSHALGRP